MRNWKLRRSIRAVIVEGMAGAVRYGTARTAKLDSLPLTILGKTGTAMPAKGFRTNGWFIDCRSISKQSRTGRVTGGTGGARASAAGATDQEAAAVAARPIFETFANLTNGKQENNAQQKSEGPQTHSATRNSQSAIRVHLVHDNVTEELSLEDYVLGVMRAEGTMETEPGSFERLWPSRFELMPAEESGTAREGWLRLLLDDALSKIRCRQCQKPDRREGAMTQPFA